MGRKGRKKIINTKEQGLRRREAQKRYLDNIREDMKEYYMTYDMAGSFCLVSMPTE